MFDIFVLIAHGLGSVLWFLYKILWSNYGLAIIVLTILLRIALLPLSVKSFKAMVKMHEIQPLLAEIQRKYKDDKEMQTKEIMKIYQEKKINPFGGCLPVLLQIPILYGLFLVISQPLTYMLKFSPEDVAKLTRLVTEVSYKEVAAVKAKGLLNMDFLGVNLANVPSFIPSNVEQLILWSIPVLAGVTTYLSSKYGQIPSSQDAENPVQKQMLYIIPAMAIYFSFVVPAGLSLYWIVSNIFQMIQQKYLIKLYLKKGV